MDNNLEIKLTTEQMFTLRRIELDLHKMSPEQLRAYALECVTSYMKQYNATRDLLKKEWFGGAIDG